MMALASTQDPPRLARLVLRALSVGREAEAVDGDLLESFRTRLSAGVDARTAARWYWSQVARSLWPLITMAVRRRDIPEVTLAVFLGASVIWAPLILVSRLDPSAWSETQYSLVLGVDVLASLALAPLGARVTARMGHIGGLAAPFGLMLVLLLPPLLAIGLLPEGQPLWARLAWVLLVPTTAFARGVVGVRRLNLP